MNYKYPLEIVLIDKDGWHHNIKITTTGAVTSNITDYSGYTAVTPRHAMKCDGTLKAKTEGGKAEALGRIIHITEIR